MTHYVYYLEELMINQLIFLHRGCPADSLAI